MGYEKVNGAALCRAFEAMGINPDTNEFLAQEFCRELNPNYVPDDPTAKDWYIFKDKPGDGIVTSPEYGMKGGEMQIVRWREFDLWGPLNLQPPNLYGKEDDFADDSPQPINHDEERAYFMAVFGLDEIPECQRHQLDPQIVQGLQDLYEATLKAKPGQRPGDIGNVARRWETVKELRALKSEVEELNDDYLRIKGSINDKGALYSAEGNIQAEPSGVAEYRARRDKLNRLIEIATGIRAAEKKAEAKAWTQREMAEKTAFYTAEAYRLLPTVKEKEPILISRFGDLLESALTALNYLSVSTPEERFCVAANKYGMVQQMLRNLESYPEKSYCVDSRVGPHTGMVEEWKCKYNPLGVFENRDICSYVQVRGTVDGPYCAKYGKKGSDWPEEALRQSMSHYISNQCVIPRYVDPKDYEAQSVAAQSCIFPPEPRWESSIGLCWDYVRQCVDHKDRPVIKIKSRTAGAANGTAIGYSKCIKKALYMAKAESGH